MAGRSALLFDKMIGWHRKPEGKTGQAKWPKSILPYLERQFRLHPKEMALLQYVQRQGSLRGLPIHHVRLYDRVAAQRQNMVIKDYNDLDQCPELIQFEGHIFQDGKIYLRRTQVYVN